MRALLALKDDVTRRRRGRAAEVWLEDETLDAALAQMRQDALGLWYESADPAVRERCWFEVHRIDAFAQRLRAFVQDAALVQRRDESRERSKYRV